MSTPKKIGMSCKNTKFIKAGLTPCQQKFVAKTLASNKARWEYLFSPERNRWRPSKK